jgi:hypothetical protein
MSYTGTVRCTHCYTQGHNRSGCPKLKETMVRRLADDPDDWSAQRYFEKKESTSKRTCSYCTGEGHNRKTCVILKDDKQFLVKKLVETRTQVLDTFEKEGFGVGSLVKMKDLYWADGDYTTTIITHIAWDKITHEVVAQDHPQAIRIRGRDVTSNEQKSLSLSLEGLSERVLSGVEDIEAQVPKNWLKGLLYDEDRFFPKGQWRDYYFRENNAIS